MTKHVHAGARPGRQCSGKGLADRVVVDDVALEQDEALRLLDGGEPCRVVLRRIEQQLHRIAVGRRRPGRAIKRAVCRHHCRQIGIQGRRHRGIVHDRPDVEQSKRVRRGRRGGIGAGALHCSPLSRTRGGLSLLAPAAAMAHNPRLSRPTRGAPAGAACDRFRCLAMPGRSDHPSRDRTRAFRPATAGPRHPARSVDCHAAQRCARERRVSIEPKAFARMLAREPAHFS